MRVNPQTGQLEDDNGNPLPMGAAIPMDQVAPQGPPPGMAPGALAANARAGMDLSQPLVLDRGGNDGPPMGLPQQTSVTPQPPAPLTPQQPPGMVRESSTTSRTHEVASPEERRAMAALRATDQDAVRIAGQQGELGQAQAQQQLEATQAQAGLRQQQAQETQARIDTGQAEAAAAKAQFDGEREKLSKMDVKDFWSTRTTGQKVAAAISLAMGAVGGVLTGKGGNVAMDVIHKAIDDDYRLQRAQIETQRGKLGDAEKNLHMTNEERARRLSELEVSQTAKWLGVGDAAKVKAAQIGTQAAAVQAQVISNGAQEKAQAHYQQWLQGMRDKVTSSGTSVQGTGTGAGGKSTESQQKLAILAQQMNGDLDTIARNPQLSQNVLNRMQTKANIAEAADTTSSKGIVQSWLVGKGREANIIPKSKYEGFGDQEQLVANAWDNVTEKYVRVLTGAGMPESEARRMALQDQPHAGESPMVTGQKFQRMKAAANQYMSQAGPAAATIAPAAPGVTAPSGGVDQAKVQMARQRLQANPNDKVARDWLAAHGL